MKPDIPTSFVIPLRAVKKKTQLRELRRLLFTNFLSVQLRGSIEHPKTVYTNALGTVEHLVEASLKTKPPNDALEIRYDLGAEDGMHLSRAAGHHWLELGLSVIWEKHSHMSPWFWAFGLDVVAPPPPPLALIERGAPFPLLEVIGNGKKALVAAVRGGSDEVLVDEGVGLQSFAELSAEDVARVRAASATGACECTMCRKVVEKKPPRRRSVPKTPKTGLKS